MEIQQGKKHDYIPTELFIYLNFMLFFPLINGITQCWNKCGWWWRKWNGEVRYTQSNGTARVKESFCSLGPDDNLIHLMSPIKATRKGFFFLLRTASVFVARFANALQYTHLATRRCCIQWLKSCSVPRKVFRGLNAVVGMFVCLKENNSCMLVSSWGMEEYMYKNHLSTKLGMVCKL